MISPQESRNRRTSAHLAGLMSAEKRIDAILEKDPGHGEEWWINTSDWSPTVVVALVDRYTRAGWKVRRAFDQRDGNALVFSERDA